ncbi:hypothetical protein [Actinospica robiniae]|uniref:hypothetical protein n=1 Tax=Actinospica robiniae TaxID=304901 RepID=UPI0004165BA7|nr:hypothetical protein [Actinospica robiniae]
MTAAIRALRSRFGALAVTALAVAVASGFAALATDAWTVALPRGIAADIANSPENGVVVNGSADSMSALSRQAGEVRTVVARSGPAGTFGIDQIIESATFDLSQVPPAKQNTVAPPQTYAVSLPAVAGSTALVQGSWPSDPAGGTDPVIPVALPVPALRMAHLSVGQTFTLWNSSTNAPERFHVTGSFRYLDPSTAGGPWNTIGSSGIEYDGPFTLIGPMVATVGAFTGGTLPIVSGVWVIRPALGPGLDVATVRKSLDAMLDTTKASYIVSLSSVWGFSVQTHLPALLAQLPSRITAGRAELLAETLLLATLAAIAIAVSCGNLVGRGEAQSALLRSRGSPRRVLVSGYVADSLILLASSAIGAGIEDLYSGSRWGLTSGPAPAEAWIAAIAVGVAGALAVLARAAVPPRAADIAAATGRQLGAPALVRAGLDGALVVLAALTLWQAEHAGLTAGTTSGGSGAVLAVTLAPAVVTLAGAAVCGRLVTATAKLSERMAERVASLPVRLAAWELARTPLRYLVPALLCVASVAGCAYAAGQDASQIRSAHDQAAFSVGADASLTLVNPVDVGQVGTVTRQPGVLGATPEIFEGTGSSDLMAVDSHTAAQTVALRADLADGHPAEDWSAITPAADPGIPVPGKPDALGLTITLTAPGLGSTSPILDIEDAVGLTYQLPLGTLPADGRVHTLLTATGALGDGGAAYPLRITGLSLGYTLPPVGSITATVDVAALLARAVGSGTTAAFPGAQQLAMKSWTRTVSSTLEPYMGRLDCPVPAGSTIIDTDDARTDGVGPSLPDGAAGVNGSGARVSFSTGEGLDMSVFCESSPVVGTLTLGTGGAGPLPVLATASYLHDNSLKPGSVVSANVAGVPLKLVIKASVTSFPGLPLDSQDALVVDLGALGAALTAQGGRLPAAYVWLMHTAGQNAPASLPAGASVRTAKQVAAGLLADPLARVPQRVITLGAPVLVGLALLGLLVSLLAAARGAAARDVVLAALGTTRPQRAVLACVLYTAVVTPAVVLGGLLGFALCRLLIPGFVLAPDGTAPTPSPLVLLAEPWTVLAGVLILIAAVAAALIASLRRGDPLALARNGG